MIKFWVYFWGAIIAWHPLQSHGYLNIFINHREVMKLMGLEADLFYVHEGTINTYAMHFTVPVPADIHELEFSWQSLTAYPLPYAITIEFEADQDALSPPTLSIPARGFVPTEIESFIVYLPCTGNATEQVPLTINMLVHGPPRTNDTKLHFKRNKICLKGIFPARNQSLAPAQAPSQGPALLGAVACAVGVVIVLGLVVSAMYVRAKKHLRQDTLNFNTTTYGSHQNVFIRLDPLGRPPSASGSYATITSLDKYPSDERKCYNIFERFRSSQTASAYATALLPTNDPISGTVHSKPESICPSGISYYASSQVTQMCDMSTPKNKRFTNDNTPDCGSSGDGSGNSNSSAHADSKDKFRQLPNVQPGILRFQQLVKGGTYARIYTGKLSESCDLLIKTVAEGASLFQVALLLQDASTLIGVSHQNILAPMLANTELPGPPEIAYPHPSKGNLKMFLQKSRKLNSPLSTRLTVEFGLCITKALAHLHSLGIIHRDVAARNCFIDLDFNLKICDSALSRDLFPNDYHCLDGNETHPVKWMAPESLQKNCHTAHSDIWMLGVLFWELVTLALTPFVDLNAREVSTYLADGYRLGQPLNCPDELFTVMSCCWLEDPKQRPSTPRLLSYLKDFYEDLGKYIYTDKTSF